MKNGKFLTLGIETSCDETSIAVTADGREIARESGYFSLTGILQQIERFQSLFGDSAE